MFNRIKPCRWPLWLLFLAAFGQLHFSAPRLRVRLRASYDALTVKDLKQELKLRGLSLTGRKSVLIERLQASDVPRCRTL